MGYHVLSGTCWLTQCHQLEKDKETWPQIKPSFNNGGSLYIKLVNLWSHLDSYFLRKKYYLQWPIEGGSPTKKGQWIIMREEHGFI